MIKVAGISSIGVVGVAGICGGFYLLSREKTIGDRVSKSGLYLIKHGDDNTWKLAAKHLKLSDSSLATDLTPFDASIKSNTDLDLEKVRVALEKWCKDASNKELSEQNINSYLEKVKSRCTTPPPNIKEKLDRENKNFTSDWGSKFSTLKTNISSDSKLEGDLKAQDGSIKIGISESSPPEDKYAEALKKWCESQLSTKIESDDYSDIYAKVLKRCI